MTGEKDLKKLLKSMSPELLDGEVVFCTFPDAHYGAYPKLEPLASIREAEGLTLVIQKSKADEHHLGYESVFRQITLNIHSSLDAVGLTAAFSNQLSVYGISANVIAGYYHDHIFVQSELAEKALQALLELTR